MILRFRLEELNNYSIYSDWHLVSDHAPLTITIPIVNEYIQTKKHTIVKNREKEKIFVNEVIKAVKDINMSDLSNVVSCENVVYSFAHSLERI